MDPRGVEEGEKLEVEKEKAEEATATPTLDRTFFEAEGQMADGLAPHTHAAETGGSEKRGMA